MEAPSSSHWQSMLQEYVASPNFDMEFEGIDTVLSRTLGADQLPSPALSSKDDYSSDPEQLVSISTTFYPSANHENLGPGNLVLRSQDDVHFYCHSDHIRSVSDNNFDGILSASSTTEKVLAVQEPATILNIVLHTAYNLSCTHYAPSLNDILLALNAMQKYGILIRQKITPSTHLFQEIMAHAPEKSLEVYTLAATYDLYPLAEAVSPYLLSLCLSNITDEIAMKMGPVYLKRLFFLHFGRSEALKRLLIQPPHSHPPTTECDFDEQRKVTRAWALASAYIAWDAKPDLAASTIDSALTPLVDHLACQLCKKSLQDRVKALIASWSEIKLTI